MLMLQAKIKKAKIIYGYGDIVFNEGSVYILYYLMIHQVWEWLVLPEWK